MLKQRLQNENIAKQQLQKSASEVFFPITKTLEENQKKTDERQDRMLQNIEQHLAIEEAPRSRFVVDFEGAFSDEEKQLLIQNDFEINLRELIDRGPDFINQLIDRAIGMNRRLGGSRRRGGVNLEEIDAKIETFRKYREKLRKLLGGMELTVGRGLKDPKKLCERLNLLVAAKQAGNNNKRLDKEIARILKKLESSKCISHDDQQKLSLSILK